MNEGTVAILIQWCLICLVWMGSFDLLLRELNLSRRRMLAILVAFLVCSFVSWTLAFAPVEISLSGTIMPLLFSGWLYVQIPAQRRRFHLFAAIVMAWILFWLRWIFFSDPILLFWDERIILPTVAIVAAVIINRRGVSQLFCLLLSIVLADAIYGLYFGKMSGTCQLGSEFAQDLIWSSLSFWFCFRVVWLWICRWIGWSHAEPSKSDARRG